MALKDRIKNVYEKHVVSTRAFGESGSFIPFETKIARPILTSVTVREVENENDGTRSNVESIEVFILRDELGGALALSFNDKYVRDPAYDSDATPYVFVGEILEEGLHYTRAVFERVTQGTRGRGQ